MTKTGFDFSWWKKHLLEGLKSDRISGLMTPQGLAVRKARMRRQDPGSWKGGLISQCRQVYCLARGYMITGRKSLGSAASRGAECLLNSFVDPEYGGCCDTAGLNGQVFSDNKTAYSNSHVTFGLAFAARATGDIRFREAAQESAAFMRTHMVDEHGGMYCGLTRDLQPLPGRKSQNPLMHEFEGLLALGDLDGCQSAYRHAGTIARFVTTKLLRAKDHVLPEYFEDDWRVLPGRKQGKIFIGHAFEWAFFLLMAVERGFPRKYRRIAEKMMETGLRIGFDPEDGGIFSVGLPEGGLAARYKTWWEQCEALRVLLRFAIRHGRDDLWPQIHAIADYTRRAFINKRTNVWYFRVDEHGKRDPRGGLHRLDYHSLGLCAEIERLSRWV